MKKLEILKNIKVHPCGLFIDPTNFFLGSSPDGLLDDDGLVKVKCPYKGFGQPVEEGIEKDTLHIG